MTHPLHALQGLVMKHFELCCLILPNPERCSGTECKRRFIKLLEDWSLQIMPFSNKTGQV